MKLVSPAQKRQRIIATALRVANNKQKSLSYNDISYGDLQYQLDLSAVHNLEQKARILDERIGLLKDSQVKILQRLSQEVAILNSRNKTTPPIPF